MQKKILVPYDFSETSQQALETGIALSLKYKATLVVLHVIERTFNDEFVGLLWPTEDLNFQLKQKIESEIENRMQAYSGKIQTEIIINLGRAYIEILRTVEKEKIDLVVIGTHGRTGLKHSLLGSVAEKVIQRSPVPVLIQRGKGHYLPKKILIPIDFSEASQAGFDQGLKWAKDFDAEIHLLHVVDLYDLYTYDTMCIPIDRRAFEASLIKEGKTKLLKWQQKISTPHHEQVRIGNPILEIQKVIQENSIDLVVLATHGRTGLKHFFLGSVAEQVVRSSPCAVLTVRPTGFLESNFKLFEDADALEDYMKNRNV